MAYYHGARNYKEETLITAGWNIVDEALLDSIRYKISVSDSGLEEPHLVNSLVIVWGSGRSPQYLGRITKIFGITTSYYPGYTYRYSIEKPDGSIDAAVHPDFISSPRKPISKHLDNLIEYQNQLIQESTKKLSKLFKVKHWAENNQTGWFKREYQNKPPKKTRVRSKSSG